jgi:hypothetical protein
MMRRFLLLGLCALSTIASAFEAQPAAGNYRFVPDDAIKEHCRKHKLPLPKGELVLRDDNTFTLSMNDEDGVHRTYGSYVVEKDLIRFSVEDGLGQELPHVMRLGPRGLNGRGAAFARSIAGSAPPAKPTTDPEVAPTAAPAAPLAPKAPMPPTAPTTPMAGRLEGAWTASHNGIEDRTVRITFLPNGRFKYVGMGVSSAGEYAFEPESSLFVLTYREIDGQKVDDETHIVKRVLLEEEGTSFTIEKYVYYRSK